MSNDGFASFFQERFSRTVVLLIAMGASRADAEDAVQEAMTQAWQHWESIREPAAWLRTVAVRGWWKQRDAQRVQAGLSDSAEHSTAASADLSLFAAEQQQVLLMLRALPPMQCTVVALFYDGMTCGEVAELTGVTEATVRSHLRYARKSLKEMMTSGDP